MHTWSKLTNKKKLHDLSPRANYTDRATAACRRSDCQFFSDRGVPRSERDGSLRPYSRQAGAATFLSSSSSVVLTRLSGPRSKPLLFFLVVRESKPGLRRKLTNKQHNIRTKLYRHTEPCFWPSLHRIMILAKLQPITHTKYGIVNSTGNCHMLVRSSS
jgi:hypothetical protein